MNDAARRLARLVDDEESIICAALRKFGEIDLAERIHDLVNEAIHDDFPPEATQEELRRALAPLVPCANGGELVPLNHCPTGPECDGVATCDACGQVASIGRLGPGQKWFYRVHHFTANV